MASNIQKLKREVDQLRKQAADDPKRDEAFITALHALCDAYEEGDEFAELAQYTAEAIKVMRRNSPDDSMLGRWLTKLGKARLALQETAAGEKALVEAVEKLRTAFAAKSASNSECAEALWLLARARGAKGFELAAEGIAFRREAIAQRDSEHDKQQLAHALNDLAMAHMQVGNHAEALAATKESVEINRAIGGDSNALAIALWTFAEACDAAQCELDKARAAMVESIAILQTLEPHMVDQAKEFLAKLGE